MSEKMKEKTMKKLTAYHGDQKIKDKYQNRMLQHIELDELIQGTGFEEGKGCFVGCTLDNYTHSQFPIELGIPVEIAHLSDKIFEGLSENDSKEFARDFHDQITVGADLSMVFPKFILSLMVDEKIGVLQYVQAPKHKQQKEAIENVANLYREWVKEGVKPNVERWKEARKADDDDDADAAYTAAYAAAYAYTYAYAAATDAGAAAAATDAGAAAAGAYDDDTTSTADSCTLFWSQAKDKLFSLLREA